VGRASWSLRSCVRLALATLIGGSACGTSPAADTPGGDPPTAAEAPAFLSVAKPSRSDGTAGAASASDGSALRRMLVSAPVDAFEPDSTFYLAINKKELGQRWFLSAYLKQFFPDAVLAGAAQSLGTRVVSFKLQNDKLYVFDVDDRKQSSDTFGQDVIVDAYPVIDPAKVGAPKALKDYVLVDPSAGLNRFGVVADGFGSGQLGFDRFTVELAFSQRFRQLKDGATFEQAFTGYTEHPRPQVNGIDPNYFRASGILGMALRRYAEGPGFSESFGTDTPFYFESQPRLVPNTGGPDHPLAKWNVHPGMTPIKWLISPRAKAGSADPELAALGINLVDVVKRGIESWNAAFGWKVFQAELADANDSFADDDKNYFIWDTDPSVGFAFANWRTNPNTGETRGASVYFNDGFVDVALQAFPDESAGPGAALRPSIAPTPPKHPMLTWAPFPRQPLCQLRPSPFSRLQRPPGFEAGLPGTRKERVEKALAAVVAHEVGHTLGLRHNFKGSLLPPSSSVMDYDDDVLRAEGAIPGAYDVAAIRFLYGLSSQPPAQPFCTDEEVGRDPTCQMFDAGADPLRQFWGPLYQGYEALYLQSGDPFLGAIADLLMGYVTPFAQAAASDTDRLDAFELAVAGFAVPVPASATGNPAFADAANALTRTLLGLLVPDPAIRAGIPDGFGPPPAPPLDVAVTARLLVELRGNLLDLDGIRTFATRRLAVDSLKWLQSAPAYDVLREARTVLSTLPPAPGDEALTDDLVARIARAVSPYFD
jgi:hypothetical protein